MKKHVTFTVNCTYTVEVDMPDGDYLPGEIVEVAERKINETDVNTGDLESESWHWLQITDANTGDLESESCYRDGLCW